MLKKIEHSAQLRLAEMTVGLGDVYQNIDQKKNKAVMAFGLGLLVDCGPALDVAGKTEKSGKQDENSYKSRVENQGEKTLHSLPATGGQQDENKDKEAATATGLAVVVSRLHRAGGLLG